MSTFQINIPYSGEFNASSKPLQQETFSSDLIYLGNDIFVGYFQQHNQGIGYIVVYEFNDLSDDLDFTNESLAFTNRRQQLLHVGDCAGVKLVKIADNRVMAIVDATVYVLDFTGTDYVVSLTEQDFFVNGMRTRGNYLTTPTRGKNYMVASVKDNEILIVDNEVPRADYDRINSGDFKLYRVVYDPVNGTLTPHLKKELTAALEASYLPDNGGNNGVVVPLFGGIIQRIQGTNSVFINFSIDVRDSVTNTRNDQTILYSARTDLEGNELEVYPAPTATRQVSVPSAGNIVSWAWNAFALREDLIVYHHNMSIAQVLYQGDLYDTLPNSNLPEVDSIGSGGPDMSFQPLDDLHYLASWGPAGTEYTAVFKVDSPMLINTRASDQRGGLTIQRYSETPKSVARLRMDTLQKYDDNTFFLFTFYDFYNGNDPTLGSGLTNRPYPYYRIRRISL